VKKGNEIIVWNLTIIFLSLLSPFDTLKKEKKGLVDGMLFGIYFFLSIRTVAIAIAMIITITPIAKYVSMAELDTTAAAVEVGAGELVDVGVVEALLTVAPVEADDV